ncbi:MAG: flagellar export chaperone FliS [Pseudothermotoga sp.]
MKDQYIENAIRTASPAKLVEMMYEKAIEVLKDAKDALGKGDLITTNEKIKRAQDIVTELNISLDMEKGGEIARALRSMYSYMYRTLIEATVKKDVSKIDEVRQYFEELLDAWRIAMKSATNLPKQDKDNHLNISI